MKKSAVRWSSTGSGARSLHVDDGEIRRPSISSITRVNQGFVRKGKRGGALKGGKDRMTRIAGCLFVMCVVF